jgi:hypothetical protein
MRRKSTKLAVARQTLRTLTSVELEHQVRGGQIKLASKVNGSDCGAQGDSMTEYKPAPPIDVKPIVVGPPLVVEQP